MIAGLVEISRIDSEWDEAKSWVKAACKYNGDRYTSEDYYDFLMAGKKQLWLVKNGPICAVIITEIALFPQMKCCVIDICTGEGMAHWGHLHSMVEDWARDLGCRQMHLHARPGMRRLLDDYRQTHIILEKNL